MIGQSATGSGDSGGGGATDKSVGEIAQRRQDLGGVAAAQGGAILAEDDITHEVTTLDGPMAAGERE